MPQQQTTRKFFLLGGISVLVFTVLLVGHSEAHSSGKRLSKLAQYRSVDETVHDRPCNETKAASSDENARMLCPSERIIVVVLRFPRLSRVVPRLLGR